jgi:hypothetical protein
LYLFTGMSLEQLVCSLQPVRSIPLPASERDAYEDSSAAPPTGGDINIPHMSIPKELWRLVDAIWQGGGMDDRDLFSNTSEPGEVHYMSLVQILNSNSLILVFIG